MIGHSVGYAQQDPHFTQYFDNTLFVNPAYAGSKGGGSTTISTSRWGLMPLAASQ